ncbi:hypothetical protein GS432_09365 [Rhodococcus hoagii]|nr:hypothetical protein [Prescottella equi]
MASIVWNGARAAVRLLVFEQCRQVVDRQRPAGASAADQRECGVVEFLGDLRNRHVPGGGCRLLRGADVAASVLAGRHRVEGESAGSRAALGVLGAVGIVDVRFTSVSKSARSSSKTVHWVLPRCGREGMKARSPLMAERGHRLLHPHRGLQH